MRLSKLVLCASLLAPLLLLSGFSEVRHIGTEKTSQLFSSSQEREKCLGKEQSKILDELGAPSFSSKGNWYYVNFDIVDVLGIKRIRNVRGVVLHFDQVAKLTSIDSFQNEGTNHKIIKVVGKVSEKVQNPFKGNFLKTLIKHDPKKKPGAFPPVE
jgi:hypothetical protein